MVTEASSSSPASPRLLDAARETLARATDHLLSLQHPEGWWKGELETNVTIDAEDVFLRRYLGTPGAAEAARRSAEWIRSRQRPDGTWATYFGGPGDLSTTVEAYVALRIAGDPPEAAHMRRAGWRRAASSPACGCRSSRSGRGTTCRCCRRSRSCCRRPRRSPSTRSGAGRGRRSSRCRS